MTQQKLSCPCPRCHNLIPPQSGRCWKCGTLLKFIPGPKNATAPVDNKSVPVTAKLVGQAESELNSYSFGLSSLLLSMTLIAICLGLFAVAPGLGILMAVCALPAFIRTWMVVQRRKQQGRPVAPEAKIGLYLGSFGVTLIVAVVTIVAALGACIVALVISCFAVLSSSSGMNSSPEGLFYVAMALTAIFTLFIAGLVFYAFSIWIRQRWQRDIGQS